MVAGAGSRTQNALTPGREALICRNPVAPGRGVFCFLGSAQAQQDGQAAVDPQVELAQAFQRDEVHALDQLAQFGAQIFAGVAFQGLLQIFGKPPRPRRYRCWRGRIRSLEGREAD